MLDSPKMQVINALDALGNPVFSDGVSLVFQLTINNPANSKSGLAVVQVRCALVSCRRCAWSMS